MSPRAIRVTAIALVGLAAAYALALRVYASWGLSLWIDESWTAVLSSARSFPDWAQQASVDSNAPLYYFLMWLWPFEGDFGLKLPSMLLLIGAALAAGLWRPQSLRPDQAWFWAALVLLWRPGVVLFIDARYYALLFLLCLAQTIAFVRLVERPTLSRACCWTGCAALAVMSHYFAAFVALSQGLLLLWRLRGDALRLWPAALLFALPAAEIGWHWPYLRTYVGHNWYVRLSAGQIPQYLAWTVTGSTLSLVAVVALLIVFRRKAPTPIGLAAAASVLATVLLIALGTMQPVLVDRYLLPVVPGLLLAVAAFTRPVAWLPIAAILTLALPTPAQLKAGLEDRSWYGLEVPLRQLPRSTTSVDWTMVYAGAEVLNHEQMRRILADALARNGMTARASWRAGGNPDATIILATPPLHLPGCREHRGSNSTTLICASRGSEARSTDSKRQ